MERLKAEIYKDRIKANISVVMAHVPETVQVIGVVKSGGYGHGASEIAKSLIESEIGYIAVSDLEEGLELRKQGLQLPILVLGEISERNLAEAVLKEMTVTLSNVEAVKKLSRIAEVVESTAKVHVKVDTGMGRFGMEPESVVQALEILSKAPYVKVEGLFSHLSATFCNDDESNAFTLSQLNIFDDVCQEANKKNLLPEMVHIGSSTALIGFPDLVTTGFYNSIRIGTLFLGYEERKSDWKRHVKPVAEIYTDVHMIRTLPPGHTVGYAKTYTTNRETRLAILPIGYGHGFHRDLGNIGEVVINGVRAAIVGKPSLGQIIVDITHIPEVKVGDRVILAGKAISAFEEGCKIGRGTWEIMLPLLEHCERSYI
jgi:alanine racemase